MAYRENDPKVLEDAENRAALERLAAVGLAKKNEIVLAKQSAELAARTRTTSARFRGRAWSSPRKLRFVGFWFVSCAGLSILFGLVRLLMTRDLAEAIAEAIIGFICLQFSTITAMPVLGLYAIHAALWRRRDAVALVAWSTSLPFPMASFVETLSLDHELNEIRIIVRFARGTPDPTILDGLVGNLDKPDRAKVVSGEGACAFFRSSLSDANEAPNDVVAFMHEIVAKVLLPLHAVHTIESARLDEATSAETWDFGEAHDKLVQLLTQPR